MELSYDEIVAVMGREPDAVETDSNGGRILVYNAKGNYLKERYEGAAQAFFHVYAHAVGRKRHLLWSADQYRTEEHPVR